MVENDVIRITGSESFVKKAGNVIVSLMVGNYNINDSGTRQSKNPKYKNNYIRYIRVEEKGKKDKKDKEEENGNYSGNK